jgi:hydrogenase nickel incorporation protein HypA/HybF
MHELSLAQRMVEVMVSTAAENGGGKVTGARVIIGELTGVDPETLRFAFDVARRDTLAADCVLEVIRVPLQLKCRSCGREWAGELLEPCPGCATTGHEVRGGRELRLESIEIDDSAGKTGVAATATV